MIEFEHEPDPKQQIDESNRQSFSARNISRSTEPNYRHIFQDGTCGDTDAIDNPHTKGKLNAKKFN